MSNFFSKMFGGEEPADNQKTSNMISDDIKGIHCEYCGKNTDLSKQKFIAELIAIINLDILQFSKIDKTNNVIYLKDGKQLEYSFLTNKIFNRNGSFAVAIQKLNQHIICSEACENEFLSKYASLIMPWAFDKPIMSFNPEMEFAPVFVEHLYHDGRTCKQCATKFKSSLLNKYQSFKISGHSKMAGRHGVVPEVNSYFDAAISDISANHLSGNYFIYNINKAANDVEFCSNECAYKYSVKENSLILFLDTLNKASMHVIIPHMIEINRNLSNKYLYRGLKGTFNF